MFEQKDALPRAELHSSVSNRYCLARASQHHPDMRRHIIAAFRTVCEVIGILGNQPVKKLFQIAARGRIGILHYDDTATGVLNEHSHCPVPYSARVDLGLHIIGDFVQSFTLGAEVDFVIPTEVEESLASLGSRGKCQRCLDSARHDINKRCRKIIYKHVAPTR